MVEKSLRKNRAAIYVRRSTDKQEHSIGDQRSELERYAAAKGYRIVREYRDEGISGDRTERREGFLAMRTDAAGGEFDVILVWDLDRWGRFDPLEAGHWIYPIRAAGVRLETIGQGPIDWDDFAGRISFFVQSEAKHSFLKDLSRNICRAQLAKAREGRGTGGNRLPFGYAAQKTRDERGKVVESKLVIEPAHAAIVRRVFGMYLEAGGSLRAVAHILNREKVPTPATLQKLKLKTQSTWNITTLRGILTNLKHTGAFVWGTQGTGSYHTTCGGEIVVRRKNQRATKGRPIIHENSHEPIIDKETFAQVQKLLAVRKFIKSPRKHRTYVLAGLLKCGDCGGAMIGKTWSDNKQYEAGYLCSRYQHGGASACRCNSIKESPILETVSRLVIERYLSEEAIKRIKAVIQAEQTKAQTPTTRGQHAALEQRIKELNKIIDQGAEKLLAAPSSLVPILAAKLDEHREERDRLASQLTRLASPQTSSQGRKGSEVDEAVKALRNMRETLKNAGAVQVRELLTELVSRVELHFDHTTKGTRAVSKFREGVIHLKPALQSCSQSSFIANMIESTAITFKASDIRKRRAA